VLKNIKNIESINTENIKKISALKIETLSIKREAATLRLTNK
jgi:hypothetical protein